MSLPVIAMAIGDPAGIGPEIALKAAADPRVRAACRPLLVGDRWALELYARDLGLAAQIVEVARPAAAAEADGVAVLDVPALDPDDELTPGRASAACGRATLAYAARAVDLAQAGEAAAVVAAPHTQAAIARAGIRFDGYPGFVAARTGTDPDAVFLMLASERFRIAHVTLHVGLRAAIEMIDRPRIVRALAATRAALVRMGVAAPRIAVAGVNPHAGEGGLFGGEEAETVAPAIAEARAAGVDAHGPFGADTMLLEDGWDAFLVMYHDQGHIPAKLAGFDCTAAVTIGAPVLFSSVAHGSAYDIAGKGAADPGCLVAATLMMSGAGRSGVPDTA